MEDFECNFCGSEDGKRCKKCDCGTCPREINHDKPLICSTFSGDFCSGCLWEMNVFRDVKIALFCETPIDTYNNGKIILPREPLANNCPFQKRNNFQSKSSRQPRPITLADFV